jgi:hypothetical protein
VRTLVVSDLHLGSRTKGDVLRNARWRAALLGALAAVDRLVLLGDVVELRHGPVREALDSAGSVLEEIGDALGPGGEVVIVPGNHDHHLLSRWFERRASAAAPAPLGLESAVEWHEDDVLATVAGFLAPAAVRAAYPGVWLERGVYATHGHYSDRHTTVPLFERLAAGAMARVVGEPSAGPARAEEYESTLAPMYAWVHMVAQNGGARLGRGSHGASTRAWRTLTAPRVQNGLRGRLLVAGFPLAVAALNAAKLGPLRADISGPELRRAGLRAFGEVLARLEVPAAHVVFGHTHRAGPLPGDELGEWRAPTGAQLINSGCWVHEPGFLGARPDRSPYRVGFAVIVEDDAAPRLLNLLDGISRPDPG